VVELEATLSIYSASVYPPDSPYTYLLSWNTLFDTVYSTFNTSGVVAIGGVLLAAGGKKMRGTFTKRWRKITFIPPPPTHTERQKQFEMNISRFFK
jgi:hypothetical protein